MRSSAVRDSDAIKDSELPLTGSWVNDASAQADEDDKGIRFLFLDLQKSISRFNFISLLLFLFIEGLILNFEVSFLSYLVID